MRIISKFIDYYDKVQGVMYDDTFIYHRKYEKIASDIQAPRPIYVRDITYIGFCGKVIPVYIDSMDYTRRSDSECKELGLKKFKTGKYDNDYIWLTYDIDIMTSTCRTNTRATIESIGKQIESLNLFDKYNTPIYTIYFNKYRRGSTIKIAPTLSDYNFQIVYDPYTAYQELVMWIGNKAVMEYPPQITDNVVLRDSKGFDKWSFKKVGKKGMY